MNRTAPPRILLAEDDPVSRAFLAEALRQFGCEPHAVEDGEAALRAATARRFDLLILDRSLPGLRGDQVLHALRTDEKAASRATGAIATTAAPDPEIHASLRAAGFARVMMKPLSTETLRQTLNECGFAHVDADEAVLDDTAGLAASGNAEILSALRGLFAAELDALIREFEALHDDRLVLSERLHRLRAACGFCGAVALQTAAAEWSDALHTHDAARLAECGARFKQMLAATRQALGN